MTDWKQKLVGLPAVFRGQYLGHVADAIGLKAAQVVEVGVGLGHNARVLRETFPDATLYLVDPFEVDGWYRHDNPDVGFYSDIGKTQAEYDAAYRSLFDEFMHGQYSRVRFMRTWSFDAATHFRDGTLDIVFIDDDHSYEGALRSITAWLPKVRRGGILAGHDVGTAGVDRAIAEAFGGDVFTGADSVWVHVPG